jgi:hypothetical protein
MAVKILKQVPLFVNDWQIDCHRLTRMPAVLIRQAPGIVTLQWIREG